MLVNEFLGRRRRGRELPVDALPDRPAPAAGSPDDRVDLSVALRAVPAQQRAVVVLRYWEGLSVEQTAALLRIAPGSVKSQASRGLAVLREHVVPRPER